MKGIVSSTYMSFVGVRPSMQENEGFCFIVFFKEKSERT